jgi:hypothetical protein
LHHGTKRDSGFQPGKPVICHQHIAMQLTVVSLQRFTKRFQIIVIIPSGIKTGLAIVASLDNVLRHAWQINSGLSRHNKHFLCLPSAYRIPPDR